MLRSIRESVGFRNKWRGSHSPAASEVVRLEPVGANLPEKRSTHTELGDLKSGRIVEILGSPASSGAAVNEQSALGVSAVTACVSLLAQMVAKLPLYLYKDTGKGPKEVTNHPAAYLIGKFPCDLHTSFELRELMETGKGLGGNGYARVFRNSFFEPTAIEWLAPCDVEPRKVSRKSGSFVAYKIHGEANELNRFDVLHIRGFSRDGVCGISPIRMLRESIGTALAQTTAAGSLIRNGAKFNGFLQSDTIFKKEVIDDARDEFNRNYSGALNAGRVPVLNGTFKFQAVNGMSMVDAQFIESRRFELQEIARLYRVPAFLIGDTTSSTTWGSGIEQQTLGFLNFCLDPHLVAWEQVLAYTLLTIDEQRKGFFFKFDRDQLANVALEARANFYQTMRNIGALCVNDIRAKEGEPLISAEDGGYDYNKPFNANAGAAKPAQESAPEPVQP